MASKFIFLFTINLLFIVSSQRQILAPTNQNPSPFDFIESLLGCKRGDTVQGIGLLKKYLNRFGYLTSSPSNQLIDQQVVDHINEDNYFDEVTEVAIKAYQLNHNLKPTGMLDDETVSIMTMPRCGVPDQIKGEAGTNLTNKRYCHGNICIQLGSHYAFFGEQYKWPPSKSLLTYAFAIDALAIADPVSRAFDRWASVSHFRFSRIQDYKNADIRISFQRLDHGDGTPFDGPGGVLAHAFAPTDGRLHFDADDRWSVGPVPGASDVGTVGLHEIGHILGLQHSTIQEAIMFPTIVYGTTKDLNEDDIQGIRALYHE